MEDAFAIKNVATSKLQQMRRALIVSAPAFCERRQYLLYNILRLLQRKKMFLMVLMGGVFREKNFFLFKKHFVLDKTPTKSIFNLRLR